jgi:nucleoside-diphosphate-sugar epimerase
MKVLVAGASSTLASTLIPELQQFAQVVTAGRNGADVPFNLSDAEIKLPDGMTTIVQLAAHFGGKDFASIAAAEQLNVLGSLKLCHAAKQAGAKHFVYISTIFATLPADSPFYSSYSLSKHHAEETLALYCKNAELDLTIIRPGQFYGTGPAFRKHQPFLYSIADKAEHDETIEFYGQQDALRNYIHVEDLAHILALSVKNQLTGSYNCVAMQNISYSTIARAAIKAFQSSSSIRFLHDKPDIQHNAFDADPRLFELLNYYPQISMELGMEKEAAHRRQQP